MAWTAMGNEISLNITLLYMSAIFWTLGYDTIYGAQDMSDDEIIGLKSTSIKFKKNINLFVSVMYFINIFLLVCLFKDFISINFFSLLFCAYASSLFYQVIKFNRDNPNSCLQKIR